MKYSVKVFLLSALIFLFFVTTGYSQVKMGMVTGSTKGTYYQFGLNIAELVKEDNILLKVSPSKGSVENIYAVYNRPNTQLGIVQADVLAFVSKVNTDRTLRNVARRIKMVFPLYNEEIHLIGRDGIADFDDLEGKRVAIGREGSGTYLTASLLFEISGVRPAQTITIGTTEALASLKNGSIDAMFYVAGYPVGLLTTEIGANDGLALLPIKNPAVVAFYPQATIPALAYEWHDGEVSTVAVKAVLVSYNFRNANCENVGRVGQLIYENLDWLKENGHPKWKAVDLAYPLKGWEQYDCVRKKLGSFSPPVAAPAPIDKNPVLQAIKDVLHN